MRYVLLLLLFPLLIAAASALQFTSPANGTAYQGSTDVTFVWDAQPVNFTLDGGAAIELNDTQYTATLAVGNHTASLTGANGTASLSVSVNPPAPSQTITLSADKAVYELGTSSRISVSVATPGQLNLTVSRGGVQVDSYTITVQQQTDFLYTPAATGSYSVLVTGQGASATTSFTVQNTTMGVSIAGSSSATAGRIASFTATATGGTAPYTYAWQFSDGTSSSGPTADHVFDENGTYTLTVIAQDTTGKQASASKNVTVTELVVRLDVTVIGLGNNLLEDAIVTLTDSRGGRTEIADEFGEVRFSNLSAGNYTLKADYNDTSVSPTVAYTNSTTLSLDENDDVLLRLPVPAPASAAANTTNTTNSTTTTNTTNTTTSETEAAAAAAALAQSEATQEAVTAAQKVAGPTPEEALAAAAFEETRSAKLEALRSVEASLARSSEKQQTLQTLGLTSLYESARQRMASASTEEELTSILRSVPSDVIILAKDSSTVQRTAKEAQADIEALLAARSVTERSDERKYRFNVEQALKETTVTTKRTVVRVLSEDGSQTNTYTIFSRSIQAPEDTTFIEFIPKSVAGDASELHVDGSHEVLDADPVLRFLASEYSYYVEGEADGLEQPSTLPVPFELVEPPSIIGFVAVTLKLDSFAHGGLYLLVLAIILGVVIAGNVVLRRSRTTSSLPAFTELAEITLSTVEGDNYEIAAKYAQELRTIHATLEAAEQAQTADIVTFLTEAATVHEFRTALAHLETVINLDDTAAVGVAYERVMHHFESLPSRFQQQEQGKLEQANALLEQHLSDQEVDA